MLNIQNNGTLWVNLVFAKKTKKKFEPFLSPSFGSRLCEYNYIDLRFVLIFFANVKNSVKCNCDDLIKNKDKLCITLSIYEKERHYDKNLYSPQTQVSK